LARACPIASTQVKLGDRLDQAVGRGRLDVEVAGSLGGDR
jgi:hypothetical protein